MSFFGALVGVVIETVKLPVSVAEDFLDTMSGTGDSTGAAISKDAVRDNLERLKAEANK